MKDIIAYLHFDGNCRAAMEFYERCLGGELYIKPFSEAPDEFSEVGGDRIIHATLRRNGSAVLMAADVMPGTPFEQGNNFSVIVECESVEETERLFAALGENGTVTMPLQDTFWDAHFGELTDQFGVNWMFNCHNSQE